MINKFMTMCGLNEVKGMDVFMEKENQRVKLTKRIFKDTLIALLKEKAVHEIKVKELCDKAELNRTTFYKYYENIYDVLADVEYDVLKDSEECINEIEDITESQIKNTLYKQLCNIQKNKDVYYLLLINSADNEFYGNLMKTTVDFLKKKTEQTNVDLGENYEYIFSYIIAGTIDIIKRWLYEDVGLDANHITNLIYDLSNKILGISEN